MKSLFHKICAAFRCSETNNNNSSKEELNVKDASTVDSVAQDAVEKANSNEVSADTNEAYEAAMFFEERNDLEAAYKYYCQAASAGLPEAMFRLYNLFVNKGFHAKENNNMAELLLSGKPVMPWDVTLHKVPDFEIGMYWLGKAADSGLTDACYIYGHHLCVANKLDEGLSYLKKAADNNHEMARLWWSYFSKHEFVPDEIYNNILEECFTSTGKIDLVFAGFLKDGKPNQLAKYGYLLMSRYNKGLIDGSSLNFYMPKANGIPYFPVAPKRGNWETFVRVNKDVLSDGTLLTFTADIGVKPLSMNGLRIVGEAIYKSPAFGWLKEEKRAVVMKVDSAIRLNKSIIADVVHRYKLRHDEYMPANVAFFEENGEKEYSVEIAEIKGDEVIILYRYTIGGSDSVRSYFTPELLSIKLEES